jgi:hypothetical protein
MYTPTSLVIAKYQMSERWAISDISVTCEATCPNKNVKLHTNKSLSSWGESYVRP